MGGKHQALDILSLNIEIGGLAEMDYTRFCCVRKQELRIYGRSDRHLLQYRNILSIPVFGSFSPGPRDVACAPTVKDFVPATTLQRVPSCNHPHL